MMSHLHRCNNRMPYFNKPFASFVLSAVHWVKWEKQCPLTVFLSLEGDLSALLLAFWIGQRQSDVDRAEGWQVSQGEVRGVTIHGQALPDGGVVPSAASCWHGVAVAQGQGVGVTAGEVVAQRLPLEGQLPGLDLWGCQTPQGTHGLWEGQETETISVKCKWYFWTKWINLWACR